MRRTSWNGRRRRECGGEQYLHETQIFGWELAGYLRVVPSTSSIDGGGTVVSGEGFHAHGIYECRFGDVSVKARRLDATRLLCDVPSYDVPETVYLSIVDGEARDHSSESIAFVYTERPHVSLLIPDKAPISGGVEILVHGRGFSSGLTCVFGEATSPSRFLSEELLSLCGARVVEERADSINTERQGHDQSVHGFTYVDDVQLPQRRQRPAHSQEGRSSQSR